MRTELKHWIRGATACGLGLATSALALAQTDGAQRWTFTTLSTATAGTILSSPAVGPGGTIYVGVEVGSSTSSSPSGRLFALNPNGSQRWVFTTPEWVDSTPAVGADGTLYFGCWNGVVYALRPDGTKQWEVTAGSFVASSPALAPDGTIYVGAGSDLVAINPDGTLKWTFVSDDWIDSSPAIAPDGTVYVGSWDGNLYALEPDGTAKWRFQTEDTIPGSPAISAAGTIYVGSRDGKFYALESDGSLKWSFEVDDSVESSPALAADGTIYLTSTGGRLIALNPDGTERWRFPRAELAALHGIYSSPAVRADGSIVFSSSNNAIYALRPDGTLLWRTALGDVSDSSPLVAPDGTFYVGCADKKIYSFTGTVEPLATDWPQFRRSPQRAGWQPLGAVGGTNGRLVNLSVRSLAGADANTLIVGFVVDGGGACSLLLRGVGPTLENFGVTGVLSDPQLTAFAGSAMFGVNDDWGAASNADAIAATASRVGAFPLPPASRDAALLNLHPVGGYTVQVTGAGDSTGVALMEAYDSGSAPGGRLVNLSARSSVSDGAGVLIAGFVVNENTRAILVRGVGPSLAGFGVAGALANPRLRIFQGSHLVAENNDWSVASDAPAMAIAAQRVGAFSLTVGSLDSALLLTLPPNAYTAQVSGVNGAAGVALVEVYEVP